MMLGRDLLTPLGLNLKISDHVIKSNDGPFKGSKSPMIHMGTYEFYDLNTGNITPEESFTNAYTEEINESEQVHTSTKQLRIILDAIYEKVDLNKVMRNKYQHMIETQRNKLLKLLQKLNRFSMEHIW